MAHNIHAGSGLVSRPLFAGFLAAAIVLTSTALFGFQHLRSMIQDHDYLIFLTIFFTLSVLCATIVVVTIKKWMSNGTIILLTVIVLAVAFATTLQIYPQANGSPVVGWDSYYNVRVATDIENTGIVSLSRYSDHYTQDYLIRWPAFPTLSAELSLATGIGVLDLSRYIPTLINIPSVFVLYLIGRKLPGNRDAYLLGAFALVFLYQSFSFHSWMVEEALGFPLFLLGVASAWKYSTTGAMRWGFTFLVVLTAATCAHYLSTFMIGLFLLILAVLGSKLGNGMNRARNPDFQKRLFTVSALAIVVWMLYLAVIGFTTLRGISLVLLSVFAPGQTIKDYRGYSVYWDYRSAMIVLLTFAVALYLVANAFLGARRDRRITGIWNMATVAWGGGLFAFVFAFSRVFKSGLTPNYSRFLAFPWVFIFQSGLSRAVARKASIETLVVCLAFCTFNFISINPYVYSGHYELAKGEQYLLNSQGDFETLTAFPLSGVAVCDAPTAQIVNGWMLLNVSIAPYDRVVQDSIFGSGSYTIIRTEHSALDTMIGFCNRNLTLDRIADTGGLLIYAR